MANHETDDSREAVADAGGRSSGSLRPVELRFTPFLTSTPEQRIRVERAIENSGAQIAGWRVRPHEDPEKGPWGAPSLEVLVDARGSDGVGYAVALLSEPLVKGLAEIRRELPSIGFSVVVNIGDGMVYLGFRVVDDPDAVVASGRCVTSELFGEAAALGWDPAAAQWMRL